MELNITALTTSFLIGLFGSLILYKNIKKNFKFPKKIKTLSSHLKKLEKRKFTAHIISILHQLIMFSFAFKNLKTQTPEKTPIFSLKTENSHFYYFSFSMGYYIYDTIFSYISNYEDKVMYLHHLFMILLTSYSIYFENYANLLIRLYFIGEMTGPLLMLFEILKYFPDYKLFKDFVGFLFGVAFLGNRLFYGVGITVEIYSDLRVPLVLKGIVGIGVYISVFWTFRLVKEILKGIEEIFGNRVLGVVNNGFDFLNESKVFFWGYQMFCIGIAFFSLVFFDHDVIF